MDSYNFEEGTKNAYTTRPMDIKDKDRFGYKIIAIISGDTWCAYRGGTDWSDERTAIEGDPIAIEVAEYLFPSIAKLDISYQNQ